MTELTLTVARNGDTYTYGNSSMSATSPRSSVRVQDLEVEVGDVTVTIQDTFLGASSPLDLPAEEVFRAKLEVYTGTETRTVLDGAVRTQDITYSEKRQEWTVVVSQNAARSFWAELSRRYIGVMEAGLNDDGLDVFDTPTEAEQYLNKYSVKHLYQEEETSQWFLYQSVLNTFYEPVGTMRFIFEVLGWEWSMPDYLWTYEVETPSGEVLRDPADDIYVEPPDNGLCSSFVQEVTKMAGWKVEVEYGTWPSLVPSVTMLPDRMPSPPGRDLGQLDEADSTLEVEPVGLWALSHSNGPSSGSSDPEDYSFSGSPSGGRDSQTPKIPIGAIVPAWGLRGASAWQAKPAIRTNRATSDASLSYIYFVDDREYNEDESVSTAWTFPEVDVDTKVSNLEIDGVSGIAEWGGYPMMPDRDPFTGSLGNRGEKLQAGESTLYIIQAPAALTGSGKVSHMRAAGAPSRQDLFWGTGWMSSAYQDQPQRRAGWREYEVSVQDPDLPRVGDPNDPIQAKETSWTLAEKTERLNSDVADVMLQRPIQSPDQPARPTPPDSGWRVARCFASYTTIDRGNGKEDWIFGWWEPTESRFQAEIGYLAHYRNLRDYNQLVVNRVNSTDYIIYASEDPVGDGDLIIPAGSTWDLAGTPDNGTYTVRTEGVTYDDSNDEYAIPVEEGFSFDSTDLDGDETFTATSSLWREWPPLYAPPDSIGQSFRFATAAKLQWASAGNGGSDPPFSNGLFAIQIRVAPVAVPGVIGDYVIRGAG